jgi:Ca-activated chloride channel family protein
VVINWALPRNLLLLTAVPVLFCLWWLFSQLQRRAYARAVAPALLSRLKIGGSRFRVALKNGLLLLGLALVMVASARPRWGEKLQLFRSRGIAVVVALDASKSMLAEDVKPNRLARAKAELAALIDELAGNAVGIVGFAGDAYALCPLTTDLEAAKMFLDIISPEMMPVPGTDFGRAIAVSTELFNPGAATKALILVTDGEDLGKNTEAAVLAAKEAGVRIYPVAISTPEGAPIPEPGETGTVYKKDAGGNVVISRMDERKLILIAQATGGRFYRLEGFSAGRLRAELDRLEKEELGGGEFSGYVERYQGFLLAGLVALFLALFIPERKIEWKRL